MKGIKINVSNNIAQITERPQRIIAGTVGLPVEYTFDSHWDGLVKYAVFAAGKKLMMFEIENTAVIPWEVLRKPGQQLMIGVYGEHPDGTEALPTVWANAGVIRHGAVPGTAPGIPSPPPVWESIKNSIGELDELNTEHKETLVGAINEVAGSKEFSARLESTDDGRFTCDRTYAELVAARDEGRAVMLNVDGRLYELGSPYYGETLYFYPFVMADNTTEPGWWHGWCYDEKGGWRRFDTNYNPMTEEKVKNLIEENAPTHREFDQVCMLVDTLEDNVSNSVRFYGPQDLSDSQKRIARENIGAVDMKLVTDIVESKNLTADQVIELIRQNAPECVTESPLCVNVVDGVANASFQEMLAAVDIGRIVIINDDSHNFIFTHKENNELYFARICDGVNPLHQKLCVSEDEVGENWIYWPEFGHEFTEEINEGSNNNYFVPTAKAVADYVKTNPGISSGIPGAKPIAYFELDAEISGGTLYLNTEQIQTAINNGMTIVIKATEFASGVIHTRERRFIMKKDAMYLATPSGIAYYYTQPVGVSGTPLVMKLDQDAFANGDEIIQDVTWQINNMSLLGAYAVSV